MLLGLSVVLYLWLSNKCEEKKITLDQCKTAFNGPTGCNQLNSNNCGSYTTLDQCRTAFTGPTGCNQFLTIRERLNKLCPLSISQTRTPGGTGTTGYVFISDGNGALRDDYLFSGCTDYGTCDTYTEDPVSANLLKYVSVNSLYCGHWQVGDYEFDPNKRKWRYMETPKVGQRLEKLCPPNGNRYINNDTDAPLRTDYLLQGYPDTSTSSFTDDTYVTNTADAVSDNLLKNLIKCGELEVGTRKWNKTSKTWELKTTTV